MSLRVELIYDGDCPNVGEARAALLSAFARAGIPASWSEWERKAPESPGYVRRYGSPTILVKGKDVAGVEPGNAPADCCRLYDSAQGGLRGVPPVERITAALLAGSGRRWRRARAFLPLPGIGALLLPVGACPACWPAYAGLLAAAGLSFLLKTAYVAPLMAVLLAFALVALAYGARRQREYGPLWLGIAGAALALAGKFASSASLPLYAGLGMMLVASLWNSWPRKRARAASCAKCAVNHPMKEGTNV
jgi:hypothetical protein